MAFVEPFGEVRGAGACSLYTLRDGDGHSLSVTDFGAGIVRLVVPAAGGPLDVALGYDGAAAYDGGARADRPYLGCVVGRVANRIRGGAFALDGEAFTVPANDGANALHGGTRGFDRRRWARVGEDRASSITFEYKSPAGEMGFPGELTARCTYTLEGGGACARSWRPRATRRRPSRSRSTATGTWRATPRARRSMPTCSR